MDESGIFQTMGKFSRILGSLWLKPGEQATIYAFPEGQTSVNCYKPQFSTYLPNEKATHWGDGLPCNILSSAGLDKNAGVHLKPVGIFFF